MSRASLNTGLYVFMLDIFESNVGYNPFNFLPGKLNRGEFYPGPNKFDLEMQTSAFR